MSSKAVTTLATIQSLDIDYKKFSVENLLALKDQVAEFNLSDETIARYLIARNNVIEDAKEQLIRSEEWKRTNWPFLIATFAKEMSVGKLYTHGVDKEGRPLLVWSAKLNVVKDRSLEETGRLAIWWTEYITRKLPADKSKITILIDRTGANSDNADKELVRCLQNIFKDCYPERVNRVIIYPADLLFYAIWNIVKWFFDPVTRDKVQPMLYQYGVQQYIEDEFIPVTMGGQSTFVYDANNYSDSDCLSEEELAIAKAKFDSGEALEPIFLPVGSNKSSKPSKQEGEGEGDQSPK